MVACPKRSRRLRLSAIVGFFLLLSSPAFGSEVAPDFAHGALGQSNLYLSASVGTHVNRIGVNLNTLFSLECSSCETSGFTLGIRPDAGLSLNAKYWGIPGSSLSGEGQLRLVLAFGKKLRRPTRPDLLPPLRTHTLSYYLSGYASTDETSQLSGGISYCVAWGVDAVDVILENDFLAWRLRDEYRTGALAVRYRTAARGASIGVGATLLLWTGTTAGLGLLHRGEVYELSEQHGGAYSVGLVSLDFLYDAWRISVGYDSDSIRSATQGRLHDLIDDGRIARVERADRVFLQLGLLDLRHLY